MHSLSGTYGFKQTWAIYKKCTEEPYSFMYYDALKNKFYCRFAFEVRIPNRQGASDVESQITV